MIGQRPTGVAIVTRGKKGRKGRRGGLVEETPCGCISLSLEYLSSPLLSVNHLLFSPPPTFFSLPPPWKEESGDLIAFGSGPGHEQSCTRSLSVGHSYPSRKVRLFHPVDTRELVTRFVVNFVPSGTGVGGGRGVRLLLFPSFFGFPVAVLFPSPPILPRLSHAFSAAVIPCCCRCR